VKVLLDHNVPKRMRIALSNHSVLTAKEMGWAELENGDLLSAAEGEGFELMVTCDQNLSYQQNLSKRRISLVVLNTNNWNVLQRNLRTVIEAVGALSREAFV
jgi:predicted nuclease of predicted toxin-antitoxin system